jgi:hypothetical protein
LLVERERERIRMGKKNAAIEVVRDNRVTENILYFC